MQVAGFSEEKVSLYVEKFYRIVEKSHLAFSLIEKVKETPLLQTLSSFPALLVMICLLWEDTHERGETFHSMTSLYKEAVSKYLDKPFEDRDREGNSWQQFGDVLQIVGKTALTELFEGNVQIKEAKFTDCDALKKAIEVGLLVLDEGKLVGDRSVSFIHKTFQEYCAATYLSTLIATNKDVFEFYLSKINHDNIIEMEYMLRFICGLSVDAAVAVVNHIDDLQLKKSDFKIPLILLYETDISHGMNEVNRYKLYNNSLWLKSQKIFYI